MDSFYIRAAVSEFCLCTEFVLLDLENLKVKIANPSSGNPDTETFTTLTLFRGIFDSGFDQRILTADLGRKNLQQIQSLKIVKTLQHIFCQIGFL